jgi:LCP family protein required for cell wall assembly
MFEHLSDPNPPAFDGNFHANVVATAESRQRRTRLAVGGLALAPLLAVGGFAVYIRGQANELEQITVGGLAPAASTPPVDTDPTATTSAVEEPPPISAPLNILVVGVDRRPPGSEVLGSRADTIAVVRIDPGLERVSMLSIPRDLWITTSDGTSGRINQFTDDGGLVAVVSTLLNVDINHYVEVDFDGFESLIDLAGGVTIPFDNSVRDTATGFNADAGCNRLSGADALAYVRSRKLEQLDPTTETWAIDPTSDLGRIARQQDLIQRIYTTVLAENYSTTDKARLLANVVDDITVDSGLDLDGLRAIFNAATLIGADNFDTYDLTAAIDARVIDGNAVLIADAAGISIQVANLLGQPTPLDPPLPAPNPPDAIAPATASC